MNHTGTYLFFFQTTQRPYAHAVLVHHFDVTPSIKEILKKNRPTLAWEACNEIDQSICSNSSYVDIIEVDDWYWAVQFSLMVSHFRQCIYFM